MSSVCVCGGGANENIETKKPPTKGERNGERDRKEYDDANRAAANGAPGKRVSAAPPPTVNAHPSGRRDTVRARSSSVVVVVVVVAALTGIARTKARSYRRRLAVPGSAIVVVNAFYALLRLFSGHLPGPHRTHTRSTRSVYRSHDVPFGHDGRRGSGGGVAFPVKPLFVPERISINFFLPPVIGFDVIVNEVFHIFFFSTSRPELFLTGVYSIIFTERKTPFFFIDSLRPSLYVCRENIDFEKMPDLKSKYPVICFGSLKKKKRVKLGFAIEFPPNLNAKIWFPRTTEGSGA